MNDFILNLHLYLHIHELSCQYYYSIHLFILQLIFVVFSILPYQIDITYTTHKWWYFRISCHSRSFTFSSLSQCFMFHFMIQTNLYLFARNIFYIYEAIKNIYSIRQSRVQISRLFLLKNSLVNLIQLFHSNTISLNLLLCNSFKGEGGLKI